MSRSDFKDVVPELTEERIARQYAAIAARVPAAPRGKRTWPGWAVAAGVTAALAATLVRTWHVRSGEALEGTVVESGPGAAHPASVTLVEGSRVDLGPSTRARLTSARARAVRIDLERGAIEIEATHVEGRTFVVGVGPYDVRVVGTHFSVQRDPGDRIAIQVDRGAVEVVAAAGGQSRRLADGERWSGPDDGATEGRARAVDAAPASSMDTPAPAAVASIPAPGASPTPPRHEDSARELFDEAQRARADGRTSDAARAFDRLRRAFRHDPRAALSAFELGRLRLDVLGDPRGAEEALRDAIALGPSSPFREDAEARRVEALGRTGDSSGCASARAAYLARWPNGTYRRAVELGCDDR